jgi:hypothetical protein
VTPISVMNRYSKLLVVSTIVVKAEGMPEIKANYMRRFYLLPLVKQTGRTHDCNTCFLV